MLLFVLFCHYNNSTIISLHSLFCRKAGYSNMGLHESKFWKKIVSVLCSSLAPACINIIAAVWIVRQYANEDDPIYIAVLGIIGVFSTIISYIFVYKVLPFIPFCVT